MSPEVIIVLSFQAVVLFLKKFRKKQNIDLEKMDPHDRFMFLVLSGHNSIQEPYLHKPDSRIYRP